jgi:hypothetical protein
MANAVQTTIVTEHAEVLNAVSLATTQVCPRLTAAMPPRRLTGAPRVDKRSGAPARSGLGWRFRPGTACPPCTGWRARTQAIKFAAPTPLAGSQTGAAQLATRRPATLPQPPPARCLRRPASPPQLAPFAGMSAAPTPAITTPRSAWSVVVASRCGSSHRPRDKMPPTVSRRDGVAYMYRI